MIEIRKLVAIDVTFLGPGFVIAEFVLGVFGSLALGIFIASRSHTPSQRLLAAYFLTLGVNYVPMMIYALVRAPTAAAEVADEVAHDRLGAMRKYRRGSLLLLFPLVVPLLALAQERRRRRSQ